MTAWDRLVAWRDMQAKAEIQNGAEAYHGLPLGWFESSTWFCERGHSQAGTGGRCQTCRDTVVLGPPGGVFHPWVLAGISLELEAFNRARAAMLEAWSRLPMAAIDAEVAVSETACAMRQLMRVCTQGEPPPPAA